MLFFSKQDQKIHIMNLQSARHLIQNTSPWTPTHSLSKSVSKFSIGMMELEFIYNETGVYFVDKMERNRYIFDPPILELLTLEVLVDIEIFYL